MRKKARRRGQRAKGKGQRKTRPSAELQVVGEKQLRALRKKIEKQTAMRWNPDPAEVQRSVIKLVLTLVELLRKLMERQAIRRMEERTMTAAEVELMSGYLSRRPDPEQGYAGVLWILLNSGEFVLNH